MAQVITASLDEMVFEGREQHYGAFWLRQNYPLHLMAGTAIIALSAILFTFGPLMARSLGFYQTDVKEEKSVIFQNPVAIPQPPSIEEESPKISPPPQVEKPVRTLAYNIPVPTPEEDVEDEVSIETIEALKEVPQVGVESQDGTDEVFFTGEVADEIGVPDVIVEKEIGIEDFLVPDEEPQAVNLDDIKKLIGYPTMARDAGIQGMVVVRILVDKKGNYSKHKVIKDVHPILSSAVETHISKLRFTPAIQGKKPIQFWVNVPFNFILMNN
ncbi:MAG: TonB family protein [Bacteroidia bacterium]